MAALAAKHTVHSVLVHDGLDKKLPDLGLIDVMDPETGRIRTVDARSLAAGPTVDERLIALRAGRYGALRDEGVDVAATEELMRVLQLTATRTHYLEKDSPACGKTVGELNFRAKTGVTIVAVVRNGVPTTSPPTDFRFEGGDVLVLVGAHSQLEDATRLLNSGEG